MELFSSHKKSAGKYVMIIPIYQMSQIGVKVRGNYVIWLRTNRYAVLKSRFEQNLSPVILYVVCQSGDTVNSLLGK